MRQPRSCPWSRAAPRCSAMMSSRWNRDTSETITVKALTYEGPETIAVSDVPDPTPKDLDGAVVRVTAAGICGSDLHIYDGHGFSPDLGFCVGHEAVGEVVALGDAGTRFRGGGSGLGPGSAGGAPRGAGRAGGGPGGGRNPAGV